MLDKLFDLTGQVALITGASGGFGSRFATVLAGAGATVVLTGQRQDVLEELAEQIRQQHDDPAVVVTADLMKTPAAHLFEIIENDVDDQVSILVNNAGIGHNEKALDVSQESWDHRLDLNLTIPFFIAQEMARRLNGGTGSIINVGSIFGQLTSKNMIAYTTAKAALLHLTRSLAVEWAPKNIRVNALAPGWCVTDMTREYLSSPRGATIAEDIPIGRFGEPCDLDGALLLLASDAGRYITGATLVIDGGLSVTMREGHRLATLNRA